MTTDEEMSIVEEMIVILKSFREATEIMSGEKYPSLGIVLPLLKKILSTLIPTEGDKNLVREVKNTVRTDLENRYQSDEVKQILKVATFLKAYLLLTPVKGQRLNWLSSVNLPFYRVKPSL